MHKIPTTIFSGFLGSGKTTIISNLIDVLQKQGEQVVYIKNEIGDTDIDTKLLADKGIKTKELLNGCICCTLVGPFINSINEIAKTFKPDRILIEASGAADPSALSLMVSAHPMLERDGVIAIIDVVNFTGYKDLSVTAQNQTKFTDLIIFNKVELADIQTKQAVVGYVRELNEYSPIVEALEGKIHPLVVFGINSKELNSLLSKNHDKHSNHIHEDQIQTFTLKPTGTFKKENLEKLLNNLPKNIFRAKGIAFCETNSYIFNTVGSRTTFAPTPKESELPDQKNMFVFIGYHAHEYENEISKMINEIK